MAHTPRFSIIIPTYNVEAYIARCLESCINQTFSDIEILVVDDCGSDSSITIAQRYATKDPRIRIIHNAKNLGTFATRIAGIAEARGEYILLVDADDYLHLHACQTLHHATAYNASILHFKAHYTATAKAPLLARLTHYLRYILPTRFCKTPLHNEQIAYNFFLDSRQFPKFTLWDKCYKASLLRHACAHFIDSSFTPIVADDMLFFLVIASLATSYISIDKRLYFYCLNTHSSMQAPSKTSFTPIVADDMLFFLVIASLATSYISIDKRLYFYCLNTHSSMQAPSKKARRIESFSYVANALHSLKLDFSLLPQIVGIMSKDLAALIILESRALDPRASTPSSVQSVKIARRGGGRARVYTSSAYTACGFWAYPSTQDPSIYALPPLALSALLRLVIAVLESLPYLYSYVCLYYFYGVCQNLESPFAKKDSACGLESRIAAPRRVDRPPSLISLRGLQSHDSSHTILESQSGLGDCALGIHSDDLAKFRATADRKSCSTLNFAKSLTSNTTIPRIFEEKQATRELSSRAVCQHGVAIYSLESSFAKVDSRNALFANAKFMDCHATASAVSRNDYKNAVFQKVDSRENAQGLNESQAEAKLDSSTEANLNEPAKDSRICDEKPLLFKPRKEIRLGGLLTQRGAEIKGLSRKAESTKKAESLLLLKAAYAAA